jgi:hypothetical protein
MHIQVCDQVKWVRVKEKQVISEETPLFMIITRRVPGAIGPGLCVCLCVCVCVYVYVWIMSVCGRCEDPAYCVFSHHAKADRNICFHGEHSSVCFHS